MPSAISQPPEAVRLQPLLWLVWSQIASMLHFVQIQARGRKLGNRVPGPGFDFDIKHLGPDRAADRALVHGENAVGLPIPAFMVVAAIDADQNLHLRLAPEAGIVGPSQTGAGIEDGALVLAIAANDFDSRLVVGIFPQIVVRKQL